MGGPSVLLNLRALFLQQASHAFPLFSSVSPAIPRKRQTGVTNMAASPQARSVRWAEAIMILATLGAGITTM
jgi:hypothetical protein